MNILLIVLALEAWIFYKSKWKYYICNVHEKCFLLTLRRHILNTNIFQVFFWPEFNSDCGQICPPPPYWISFSRQRSDRVKGAGTIIKQFCTCMLISVAVCFCIWFITFLSIYTPCKKISNILLEKTDFCY